MPKKAPKQNSYDDDDFRQILAEIEDLEAQRRTITAEAAGKSSAIAKKIADAKKTAGKLNIPKPVLNAVLKQRKLEQQLKENAENVPDEFSEVYEDAAGQFSFLKPDGDEPAKTPAKTAASAAASKAKAHHAAEQEEGGRVLDEMSVKH